MLMTMKKEEMELKEVIKAAILEAFAEMYGVATADDAAPEEDGEGEKERPSHESSGGGTNNGRPKPDVGVGVFGLR